MHDAHEFLRSLTVVLGVAAITTVVFQRLRQPVVLGYIIAGLIVGPHVPIPIVADKEIVQTLSEMGVILLMFSLGLEFSLRKLARVGPTASVTAVIQCGLMAWLGFMTGRLFGWTPLESVFAGAAIAISSTTIIAKVFDERAIRGRLREFVVGILLIEDLIAVVLMAVLTGVATGAGLTAGSLAGTGLRLAGFLAALLAAGMLVVPRFMRSVMHLDRRETTLIASIGICFVTAFAAQEFGYSVALGAFLAGSLVAEAGRTATIEALVEPVRDLFAAIFFVSVGLLIDPALVARHWAAVVALTAVVIVGKIASVAFGAFLAGAGARLAIQSGMSLAQIGEFSFIIAGLGLSLGATGDFLYPVAVAVSAITTLTTPWLIHASEPLARLVDRVLPHRLQTLTTLYGAWLERLGGRSAGPPARVRRIVLLLLADMAILSAMILGVALGFESLAAAAGRAIGAGAATSRAIVIGSAIVVSAPLILGIGRLAHRLGSTLASAAFPRAPGSVDLDAPPRRALVLMMQLGVAIVAGAVVLAITQPVLPSYAGPIVFGALLAGFGVAIWRSARNLESHVRAGAEAVLEALSRHARAGGSPSEPDAMEMIHRLAPGLGAPVALRLDPASPAAGKSLAELNLRGRTGATVLAILRGEEAVAAPAADARLQPGDVLALVGTQESVEAAKGILLG